MKKKIKGRLVEFDGFQTNPDKRYYDYEFENTELMIDGTIRIHETAIGPFVPKEITLELDIRGLSPKDSTPTDEVEIR